MILWIIGSGGLFGSAVVRATRSLGWEVFTARTIPWNDPHEAISVIRADAAELGNKLRKDQSWGIVWAAGRATTASTQEEAEGELSLFSQAVDAIRIELNTRSNGVFLLASSAGGVYAGSANPPFNSHTTPKPIGIYGNLKRQQEAAAERSLGDFMAVILARISNLYGPGQNLGKLQGLISRLALAAITKQPLTIFVPLDTLRDYINVDDAAHVALHWMHTSDPGCRVRTIATGYATSLGYIINLVRNIARTPIPIVYGMHASAASQSQDLRLQPDLDQYMRSLSLITLPVGVKEVYEDTLLRYQRSSYH